MVFGFNTDLRVGNTVYHVQTEDRGPGNPVIDTTIYHKGRILHRRASSYREFLESPEFSKQVLRERLEAQHRAVLEELQSGALSFAAPEAAAPPPASPLQVELLNPATWLSSGTATLKLQVRVRESGEPAAESALRVIVSGPHGPIEFSGKADRNGAAEITFPLPRLGGGGMELVVRAKSAAGDGELRYALRPKPRPARP